MATVKYAENTHANGAAKERKSGSVNDGRWKTDRRCKKKKAPETKEMAPKIASPINLADSPLLPLPSPSIWIVNCDAVHYNLGLLVCCTGIAMGFFCCATILCTLDASRTAPHKKAKNMNILLRCLQFQIARHDAVSLAHCGGMQILQRPYGCLCSTGLPWP